ncbi:MAG: hypothetical protein JWM78_797 [Verrucomicrobiaceae bacterium]|nr:hypothetical protein [Verrucomicrobiaceae bacterium]
MLIMQARAKHLADALRWHALVHYKKNEWHFTDGVHSEIISPEFFLAKSGSTNPSAELEATIAGFYAPIGVDPDQHPQCRFVARYKWLRQTLDWTDVEPPLVTCKKYREWALNGHIKSVSLIFATGYLSNPASLYGHLLIKFNTSDNIVDNDLLDPSLSYGAIVPKHESGLVYMSKGLLGGYEAGFSHDKFFQHNHNYAETELRDLWEYRLALPPDEVDLIVAHGWEMLGAKFNYYFLSNNCAYEVSELLHVAIDDRLLPNTPWSIPSTVFNRLTVIDREGRPLVSAVRKIPSRQNRFYKKYFALSEQQRALVKKIIVHPANFGGGEYQDMANTDKIKTLETLFDYYEFRAADEIDQQKYRQKKQVVLLGRLKLPSEQLSWPQTSDKPPHEGNPPLMAQLSALTNSADGNAIEVRIRPAYYDMLALDAGKIPYSSLAMFDFKLMYSDEHLHFRSLDLLSIETLSPSRTGAPGDGSYAWRFRVGLEQQNLRCIDCTVAFTEGGIGKAAIIDGNTLIYGMLDARLQSNMESSGTLAGTTELGIIAEPIKHWRTRISIGERAYINGARAMKPLLRWENRLGGNKNWDWEITVEKNSASELRTSVAFYW